MTRCIQTIAALLLSMHFLACEQRPVAKAIKIDVNQLSGMLAEAVPPKLFDANGPATREKYGIIPTATLLDGRKYAMKLLPESRVEALVFYCSGTLCGAAEGAAQRALAAGYTTVKVLPVGIRGWKRAGKQTVAPPS